MNLRLNKRTQQIDDQREKLLGYATDNSPIWCEAGAHKLNGDEKAELSEKLGNQVRYAAILKAVKEVQRGASIFLEHSVMELAPPHIIDSYQNDGLAFCDWFRTEGFGFKQDGLKTVFLIKGSEYGSMTAKCDATIKEDVEQMLKFEHLMGQGKGRLS